MVGSVRFTRSRVALAATISCLSCLPVWAGISTTGTVHTGPVPTVLGPGATVLPTTTVWVGNAAPGSLLVDAGLPAPKALSVVLLGRTDMAQEHADFFDTVGCSVADQAQHLYQAITTRWAEPDSPYTVHLIPLTRLAGQSCAEIRATTASVRATDSPT